MELNKSDYNKLQAKLTKLKAIDKTALSTEIGKGALKIARDMKKIAPVDTGNLRKQIKSVLQNKQAEIPFFYPSVNKGFKEMINSIDKTIEKLLK